MNLLEMKEEKTLLKCILIASTVVISYKIAQPILLLFLILSIAMFMLLNNNMDEVVSILFFMLPFSAILKFTNDTQSFFRLLELIFIFSFLYRGRRFDTKSFFIILCFIFYSIGVSMFVDEFLFFRVVNLFIWLMILMFILSTLNCNSLQIIGKHFIYGVILSCFIGYFAEDIGSLSSFLGEAKIYNVETLELTNRFAGIWNDPNTFSSFICIALYTNFIIYKRNWCSNTTFFLSGILLTLFGILSLSKMCIIILTLTWIAFISTNSGISFLKKIGLFATFTISVMLLSYVFPDVFEAAIFRFYTDSTNDYDLNSLTTNRYSLWLVYIENITTGLNLMFGHGITAILPIGRAAHNTYLQIIYNLGIVGFILFIYMIISISKTLFRNGNHLKLSRNITDFLPVVIVVTIAFFLDYFFIETFYYLLALSILIFSKGDKIE